MSLKNICNESMKVDFTLSAGPPDAVYLGAQPIDVVKIVPVVSPTCSAAGSGICCGPVTMAFPSAGCPFTSPTHTFVAGAGSIAATAAKVTADSLPVLRVGDTGVCVGAWIGPPIAFPPVPCLCTVEISDAGQDKVTGQ